MNEFFDFDNAALESPTHSPTSAEPLCHNVPALDTSAEPALHNVPTLLKRPRAASEFEGQTDAFAVQNWVTTNIKGQAAIELQSYQLGGNPDSHISAPVSIINCHNACTDFKH